MTKEISSNPFGGDTDYTYQQLAREETFELQFELKFSVPFSPSATDDGVKCAKVTLFHGPLHHVAHCRYRDRHNMESFAHVKSWQFSRTELKLQESSIATIPTNTS